jgi:hypothetical protein
MQTNIIGLILSLIFLIGWIIFFITSRKKSFFPSIKAPLIGLIIVNTLLVLFSVLMLYLRLTGKIQ